MVSEKAVVILMVIAIVLSVVSVVTSISVINLNLIPKPTVTIIQGKTEDVGQGKINIVIFPPEAPPNITPEQNESPQS